MEIMKTLRHAHVVSFKEAWIEKGCTVCIVVGYCEGGDLMSRLQRSDGKAFAEDKVLGLFVQLALALEYLHGKRILHRDVKCSNVFLGGDGLLKVGTWGTYCVGVLLRLTYLATRTSAC